MFTSYYKLQAHPFERDADSRFFFDAQQHRGALAALEEGLLAGGGFTLLTGAEGTGKTAVLDFAMSRLDPDQFITARLVPAALGPDEVLREAASVFGLDCKELGAAGTTQCLGEFFIDSLRAGRRPVLFIDQCEQLPSVSLRALTSLADIRVDDEQVAHIVLLGRSQLRQTLGGDDFAVHAGDRVGGYHLQTLESDDTRRLIEYRLEQAGWQGDPEISDGAFELIFLKTGGVPGRVMSLCTELLGFASSKERHTVGNSMVRKIDAELKNRPRSGERDELRVTGADRPIWLTAAENAPDPEPVGTAVTSGDPAPSRWRRAIVYGEYAAGIAITVFIVWQVGTVFLAQEADPTPPADIVTLPVPAAPDTDGDSGDDDLAAQLQAEPADPPTAPEVAAPADEIAPADEAASVDVVAPVEQLGSLGAEEEDENADAGKTAEWAATAATDLEQAKPDGTVGDMAEASDQDLPSVEPPQLPAAPEFGGAAAATSQSSPQAESGDRLQSLSPTPLYKPDSPGRDDPPEPPLVSAAENSLAATGATSPSALPTDKAQDFSPTPLYTPRFTAQPEPLLVDKPAARVPLQPVADQSGFGGKVPAPEARAVGRLNPLPAEPAAPLAEPALRSAALDQPAAAPAPLPQAPSLEAEPAAAPAASPQMAAAEAAPVHPDLAVISLTLTRGIEDREPIDATDWFSAADGEVYAFARIKNPGEQTQLTFSWHHGDRLQATVELNVGRSQSWRTWSKSRIWPGDWRVKIADGSGRVLAESSFTVE